MKAQYDYSLPIGRLEVVFPVSFSVVIHFGIGRS